MGKQSLHFRLAQYFLLTAFCLVSTGAFAQAKATAALKSSKIETGDTVTLFVFVSGTAIKPKSVDFASWTNLVPRNNILQRSEWHRNGTQWAQRFRIIAFDSAQLELPPLAVFMEEGSPLSTNPLSLQVYPSRGSALSEMAPMRDIYREPGTWMDYWPWGLAALILLLVAFWYLRKPAAKTAIAPIAVEAPAPIISPAETALLKLRELQSKRLWEKDQLKAHYDALSLILRTYLESSYKIPALESTTSETLNLLASTTFPAVQIPLLRDVLQKTDLVKYAKSEPAQAIHESILDKARELVSPGHTQTPQPKKYEQKPKQKPTSGSNPKPKDDQPLL